MKRNYLNMLAKQQNTSPSPALLPQREGENPQPADHNFDIRLLLAEDDAINQLMTRLLLTKAGYLVDVASNGREVLTFLEENDYDLVLMDCMMPVMNGYDATTVIRNPASAVKNHAIPVIALTANAMQEDRDRCLAAGMNDYLAKPIVAEKIIEMLEKWLSFDPSPGRGKHSAIRPCTLTPPIFDRSEFVSRALGDLDLSRKLVTSFIDIAPGYLAAINNALAAEDAVALHGSAHRLKGAAATMSLPLLAETASRIEALAEAGNTGRAATLAPALTRGFEQAIAALRQHLSTP